TNEAEKIGATLDTTATATHFDILKLGVSIWNQWRASEPLIVPNLQNTDLSKLHLENINLCRANLRGAKLSHTYLYDADFQDADLRQADLTRALLIGANLHKADLSGAVLEQAYLAQSDLSNANFTGAHLQKADLKDALLTHAVLVDACVAEADLATSFDLTQAQLDKAKDAHLAYYLDSLVSESAHAPSEALPSEIAVAGKPQSLRPIEISRSVAHYAA
ncbi:MAG: pentapeptide repeat-containing protein, partial [Phormidesmis sp.]